MEIHFSRTKGILQPEKAASYPVWTIIGLPKRFPQLGLADSESLDQLKEDFLDFTLSPSDLIIPTPGEYVAADDDTQKPQTGLLWPEVETFLTLDGSPNFST